MNELDSTIPSARARALVTVEEVEDEGQDDIMNFREGQSAELMMSMKWAPRKKELLQKYGN